MSDVTQAAAPAAALDHIAPIAAKVAARQPLTAEEGREFLNARRATVGDTGVRPDPARTDAPKGNPFSEAGRKLNDAKKAKIAQGDDLANQARQESQEEASVVEDDLPEGETPNDLNTANGESLEETNDDSEVIDLGEGVTVSKNEIRDGFMLKADHTKKTQELAQARTALGAERTQFDADRTQRLQLFDTLLEAQAQSFGKPMSLNQHLQADPVNGLSNFAAQSDRLEQLSTLRNVRAQEQAHDNAQRKAATIKALAEKHGDKAESHYTGAVNIASEMTGLPAEYLSAQMAHPAIADIVYDAKRWRELQASKGSIVKKVADKPRVIQPGARVSQQAAHQRGVMAARDKLKSSGNLADAVLLLRTLRGPKSRAG